MRLLAFYPHGPLWQVPFFSAQPGVVPNLEAWNRPTAHRVGRGTGDRAREPRDPLVQVRDGLGKFRRRVRRLSISRCLNRISDTLGLLEEWVRHFLAARIVLWTHYCDITVEASNFGPFRNPVLRYAVPPP